MLCCKLQYTFSAPKFWYSDLGPKEKSEKVSYLCSCTWQFDRAQTEKFQVNQISTPFYKLQVIQLRSDYQKPDSRKRPDTGLWSGRYSNGSQPTYCILLTYRYGISEYRIGLVVGLSLYLNFIPKYINLQAISNPTKFI